MDLTTNYLGLSLRSPLVPSASPLSEKIDNVRAMQQAGAAAVVFHSLFEEQIEATAPEFRIDAKFRRGGFYLFFEQRMKNHCGSTRLLHRTDIVDLLRKRRGRRHQRRTQREPEIVGRQIHRLPSWIQTAKYCCIDSSRNNRECPHHIIVLMLDDVAVINVGLRRGNASREVILRADCGELAWICFHRVFEPTLGWIRRLHRSRRKWSWIDAARHAVRTAVGFFISLRVERGPPDYLERDQVAMHRMGIPSHVDVNPVLDRPDHGRLRDCVLKAE